jgi:hypothetical protein
MTHTISSHRSPFKKDFSLPFLLASLVFLFTMVFRIQLFADPDTLMHIGSGKWIFDHLTIPSQDPFSFRTNGLRWIDHEWLAQLLMAGVFSVGGYFGLQLLISICFAISIFWLARFLSNRIPPIYTVLIITFVFCSLLSHLLARPHILTWPCIVIWFESLSEAVERKSSPPWYLAFIMVLWANLHGSFILGLLTLPLFALDTVIQYPKEKHLEILGGWVKFILLSVICSFLTPHGLSGVSFGINLISSGYIHHIIEWAPTGGYDLLPVEFWFLLILVLSLTGRLKLTFPKTILLIALMHQSFAHVRYTSIMGLILPFLIASALPWSKGRATQEDLTMEGERDARSEPTFFLKGLLTLIGCVFILTGIVSHFRVNGDDSVNNPKSAVDFSQEKKLNGHVLNYYNFGGYLIHRDIPVYIDGRADVYGDKNVERYFEVTGSSEPEKIQKFLDEDQIDWTIFPPDQKIVLFLNQDSRWRNIYQDKFAVIHTRKSHE